MEIKDVGFGFHYFSDLPLNCLDESVPSVRDHRETDRTDHLHTLMHRVGNLALQK